MKIDNNKLKLTWQREGLRVEYDGSYVDTLDITDLARLDISYGDNLQTTASGWTINKQEAIMLMLGHRADNPAMITQGESVLKPS